MGKADEYLKLAIRLGADARFEKSRPVSNLVRGSSGTHPVRERTRRDTALPRGKVENAGGR